MGLVCQTIGLDRANSDQARGLVGRRTIGLPGQRVRGRRLSHRLTVPGGLRPAGPLPTRCGGSYPPGHSGLAQAGVLAAQYLIVSGTST